MKISYWYRSISAPSLGRMAGGIGGVLVRQLALHYLIIMKPCHIESDYTIMFAFLRRVFR